MSEAAIPAPTTEDLSRDLNEDWLNIAFRGAVWNPSARAMSYLRRLAAAEARVKELEAEAEKYRDLYDLAGTVVLDMDAEEAG